MSLSNFSFPTPIVFGAGASQKVGTHLKDQNLQKALVVTDQGIAPLPFFKNFLSQLSASGLQVSVFSEIWGNPVKGQVSAGVQAFKNAEADCIVGIGGGAALDVAKAIALMINHPGDLFDYEDDKPGALPIDQAIPYWVALPTTSGTGSEVGRSSVISDEATHLKKIIFSPRLLAKTVFADPELTLALPASVTASTGMDALTHNVEAYLAKGYHPLCEGIALEGIRLAAKHLETAVKDPTNLEARSGMMMSSMMGAVAFQKGLGVVHSCAHSLSTVTDMHHGLANGVMINYALKKNAAALPEKFKIMAQAVGLSEVEQNAEGFLNWLKNLKQKVGIASKLSELKVTSDKLADLAKYAFLDVCHQCNPVPCTQADFEKIFSEAL